MPTFRNRVHPLDQRSRGIATIWVVLVLAMLIGLIGLALDTAAVLLSVHQLQNTADAAALAGARHVRTDQAAARSAALALGLANEVAQAGLQLDANYGNAPAGDVVLGLYERDSRSFTPNVDQPNAVQVIARRTATSLSGPLPLVFGPMFGVSTVGGARPAIAIGGVTGAGVIVLNANAPGALMLQDTAMRLEVFNSEIHVNSTHPAAADCKAGQPTVVAGSINIGGGVGRKWDKVLYDGPVRTEAPYIPDPLAHIPEPSYDTSQPKYYAGQATLEPGYYPDGIVVNNGEVFLNPGIYTFDGVGLSTNGGNITGHGVMIHVVDTTPGDSVYSSVYLRGNGDVRLEAPTSGTYRGIAFFQARDNPNPSDIGGTGLIQVKGALYFPQAHVTIGGSGEKLGMQLIADTLDISGSGLISIDYDASMDQGIGKRVFLVE